MASSITSDADAYEPRPYDPRSYEPRGDPPREDVTTKPEFRREKPGYFEEKFEKVEFTCQNATLFLKISSALLVLSFVLQTVAVGAPYWSAGWRRDKMSWHEGVWMTCYRKDLDNQWICGAYDYGNPEPGVPAWYTFCQAMGLASIVIFLPTLLISFFYSMHPKGKMYRGLAYFNFILTFTTGFIPMVMIIVWLSGHPQKDRFPIPFRDEDYEDWPFAVHFCYIFEIFAFVISYSAFGLEVWDFHKNVYHD